MDPSEFDNWPIEEKVLLLSTNLAFSVILEHPVLLSSRSSSSTWRENRDYSGKPFYLA
jgi:hypothetical protein